MSSFTYNEEGIRRHFRGEVHSPLSGFRWPPSERAAVARLRARYYLNRMRVWFLHIFA